MSEFYLRYYIGTRAQHGHEFLEFEVFADGMIRYANNSRYKGSEMIRKEMHVSSAVLDELKRIVEQSEINRESDQDWPLPGREEGRQQLTVSLDRERMSFSTAKIGSLLNVTSSGDPEGLTKFYYLTQDLKCFVLSLISMHFKVKPFC